MNPIRATPTSGTANRHNELGLFKILLAHGFTGWQRGSKLPGKPDFVFAKLKTAVFVDGCFWHGCPRHGTQPKNNAEFWAEKLSGNQARNRRVNRELRALGWRVVRIWEHQLKRREEPKLVRRLNRGLRRSA